MVFDEWCGLRRLCGSLSGGRLLKMLSLIQRGEVLIFLVLCRFRELPRGRPIEGDASVR